ncbi:MAG: HAD hydrolase-like protein [Gammaproteobacteria bacterium]|nr:HAD hydrolase-like protein [Gammaproteobacteria bacterium]
MTSSRAVVFDLFHTLVDPEDFRPPAFTRLEVLSVEIGIDLDAFSEFWAATSLERTTTGVRVVDLVDRFAGDLGLPLTTQQRLLTDDIMGRCQDRSIEKPRSEVSSLVVDLKARGWQLGLLSNCHEREVRAWPTSPLAPYFDTVGFSHVIGAKKPKREAYAYVLDRLDVPAARSAYVGNGQSDELVGAVEAGFALVVHYNAFDATNGLVTSAERERRADQAHVSVDTIEDLTVHFHGFTH